MGRSRKNKKVSWSPEESTLLINAYKNRDKSEFEKLQDKLTLEHNVSVLYDWFYFDTNVLSRLRKNNYSNSELMNMELTELLISFLSLQDMQLLENANEWLLMVFQEAERVASTNSNNEKSDEFSKNFKLTDILEKKLKLKLKPDQLKTAWDYKTIVDNNMKDFKWG